MQVELDIFSGRPNPKWTLTDAEIASFHQIISKCPAVSLYNSQPLKDGLGYRGFRIIDPKLNLELTVKGIYIQFHKGEIQETRLDSNRNLEKMLTRTAQTRLDEDLTRRLKEIIEAQ